MGATKNGTDDGESLDYQALLREDPARVLERLPDKANQLRAEVEKVVFGQSKAIDTILCAILARGHCLLVGTPGLAKTLLVRALSRAMGLGFRRIQFTPDLMPGDITGTAILQVDPETQRRRMVFEPGPVFTQLLLADEINRTPPKTQAALLEAMQERTVTTAQKAYQLEEPFVVLATQNPIEQEGTYPLPEAQLDRFLFELAIDYPSHEDECRVVSEHSFTPLERISPVLSRDEILAFREAVNLVPAAPNVVDYAVRLTRATRPRDPTSPDYVEEWVRWGCSPRASQHLILAGKARAACQGRFNVACEDVEAYAMPVLRHRMVRTFRADADGKTADDIIAKIVDDVPRNGR